MAWHIDKYVGHPNTARRQVLGAPFAHAHQMHCMFGVPSEQYTEVSSMSRKMVYALLSAMIILTLPLYLATDI